MNTTFDPEIARIDLILLRGELREVRTELGKTGPIVDFEADLKRTNELGERARVLRVKIARVEAALAHAS